MLQSQISLAEIKLTLLASGVEYENLDPSLVWAFGSLAVPIKAWVEVWNSKHKEVFEMSGNDTIFDTIYKIGRAYVSMEQKEQV